MCVYLVIHASSIQIRTNDNKKTVYVANVQLLFVISIPDLVKPSYFTHYKNNMKICYTVLLTADGNSRLISKTTH